MAVNKKMIGLIGGGVVLMAATAAIASYMTKQAQLADAHPPMHKVAAVQPAQPAPPACDDKNIVGTVAGGVAGGVVGNQFGKGGGKTAMTIGGVVGGAVLGNQFIPTRNVTCK